MEADPPRRRNCPGTRPGIPGGMKARCISGASKGRSAGHHDAGGSAESGAARRPALILERRSAAGRSCHRAAASDRQGFPAAELSSASLVHDQAGAIIGIDESLWISTGGSRGASGFRCVRRGSESAAGQCRRCRSRDRDRPFSAAPSLPARRAAEHRWWLSPPASPSAEHRQDAAGDDARRWRRWWQEPRLTMQFFALQVGVLSDHRSPSPCRPMVMSPVDHQLPVFATWPLMVTVPESWYAGATGVLPAASASRISPDACLGRPDGVPRATGVIFGFPGVRRRGDIISVAAPACFVGPGRSQSHRAEAARQFCLSGVTVDGIGTAHFPVPAQPGWPVRMTIFRSCRRVSRES